MKKFLALLTAFAILTALCACAEKIRELSPNEARDLATDAISLDAFLKNGSANVLDEELVSENGVDYAPVNSLEYSSWEDFAAAVKEVYSESAAEKILNSADCIELDGRTYLRFSDQDGDPGFTSVSFGGVTIDGDSDSKNASGTLEIDSSDGSAKMLNIEFINTSDGWRIDGMTAQEG